PSALRLALSPDGNTLASGSQSTIISLGLNGVPPYVGRRSKRKIPWASSITLCCTYNDKMWQRVDLAWGNLITGGDWRHPVFIPDGLDPVPPLGALIATFLALCAKLIPKYAMSPPGPRRRALLERHKAIRAKLSPTELPALETALETPQQSSRDASTWGQKRPRTCLGRGALQQLSMDQQQLQGAQHQLALDQQQLQGAKRQLTLDQEQLQGAQHQLALDQQQLQGAKRQLTLDQEQLQGAQHQLSLEQKQLQGAKRQLTLDQEQLQGAQHQLSLEQKQLQGAKRQLTLDQEQLQGAQHQLALDLEQLQGAHKQLAQDLEQLQDGITGLERSELLLRQQQQHMDAWIRAPTIELPSHAAMQPCSHAAIQPFSHATMQPCSHAAMQPCSQAAMQPEMRHICFMRNCVPTAAAQAAYSQALPPVRLHNSFSILSSPCAGDANSPLAPVTPTLVAQRAARQKERRRLDCLRKLHRAQERRLQRQQQQADPGGNSQEGRGQEELEEQEEQEEQHSAMQPFSHAAMQPCSHAAMQPFSHAAMQPCSHAAMQPCSHAAMQPCSHAAMQPCSHAAMQPCSHAAILLRCSSRQCRRRRLSVERPTEIQSDHWHHHNVGIFVACAYFRNDRDEYREETVYILTDGKDQSAAVTQAALHQVLDYLQGERCMVMKQLCMWSDGCAAQFKGTPALQLHRRMAMRYKVPVWWSYGATSHFKGRHDSEGGVFKHSMAARVLADHPVLSAECKAQQLAGVHNVECVVPAAQLAASVAHQTRGSVQRRWCLVLKDEEVEKCAEPDPDAHRLLRTISGSRAMHAMFFPADGVAPMWSETACACVRHMGSKPQQCMCHGASTLSSIPMFGRVTLASDKEEDAECLKLLHARAPHIASSYMTLTMHLLKEYARGCLGWKGKRLTQKKPLLRADILEHLRWEQEMEEDQLAEVGDDEANDIDASVDGVPVEAPSPGPLPGTSLATLPIELRDDIARWATQLGAGEALSLTCRAFSKTNLSHAPALHIQLDSQGCDQFLTPRVVAALQARTCKLVLTLEQQRAQSSRQYIRLLTEVLQKLASCAAVETCKLGTSKAPSFGPLKRLGCIPDLAQYFVDGFPGLTSLSLHSCAIPCSGLAALLSHPQLSRQLQQLDLSNTTITQPERPEPGEATLDNLFHASRLKQLSLSTNMAEGGNNPLLPNL
ncbi:hypothetical protein QJQ45_025023, partial [Haematococcus lacustris]